MRGPRGDAWRRYVAPLVVLAIVLVVVGVRFIRSGDNRSPSLGNAAAKVTFVELGSVSCIPCKEMKPVMAAVETAFGDQVEVIFYDVNEDPAPAEKYGIRYIPTQVFLDEKGVEFHRHVGFYPYEDIEALLLERGLTPVGPSATP